MEQVLVADEQCHIPALCKKGVSHSFLSLKIVLVNLLDCNQLIDDVWY